MSTVNRFWLFRYESYYPNGGMRDLVSTHDELADAISAAAGDYGGENRHILDIDTRRLVWSSREKFLMRCEVCGHEFWGWKQWKGPDQLHTRWRSGQASRCDGRIVLLRKGMECVDDDEQIQALNHSGDGK